MSLKDIFCQDRAIGTLEKAFAAERVPHAYIFAGPEGVGKFTTAREWAKLLLCENKGQKTEDSCGKCQSCMKFEAEAHPDFHRVYKELLPFTKDGKNKTSTPIDLPIDVIREFLNDKVAARPTLSPRSVFVVEEAQKLNPASQNAMLKTLEEPPPYCSIILLCTRLEKLLPTTQSRCQIVNFGPIDEEIIVERLRKETPLLPQGAGKNTGRMPVPQEEAIYWARFSQGSLGVAMQWAAVKLKEGSVFEVKKELIDRFAKYRLADAVDFAEWMGKQSKAIAEGWEEIEKDTSTRDLGRRATNGVLGMIASAMNDAMKLNVEIDGKLINEGQKRQIGELAKKYDAEAAAKSIAAVYKSMEWVDASVNEKLIFEELLLNVVANAII